MIRESNLKAPETLSRAEQRRLKFQQKILNAAIELFAEKGVDETPVTEIIKRAGIAHKTFFNHFPSKTHLVVRIAGQYSSAADSIFEHEIAKDIMPVEKLENSFLSVARTISTLTGKDEKMFKQVLSGANMGTRESKVIEQEKIYKHINAILKEAEYRGQLRPELPTSTYVEQSAGLFFASILVWESQHDYPLIDRMERTVQFIRQATFL